MKTYVHTKICTKTFGSQNLETNVHQEVNKQNIAHSYCGIYSEIKGMTYW